MQSSIRIVLTLLLGLTVSCNGYSCGSMNVFVILNGDVSEADWTLQVAYVKQAIKELNVGIGGSTPNLRMGLATDSANVNSLDMCLTYDQDILNFQLNRMTTAPGGASNLTGVFSLINQEFSYSSVRNNIIILITTSTVDTAGVTVDAGTDIAVISVAQNYASTLSGLATSIQKWGNHLAEMTPFTRIADYEDLDATALASVPCIPTGIYQSCGEEYSRLSRAKNDCKCGCSDQSLILLWYIFLDLMISALRAFYLSYTAIKTYLIGQNTTMSPRGLREHACSFLYLWLLALSLAFFRSPCPDNWAEFPMMCSILAIYLLMWMPAFVRIIIAKNKIGKATEELSNDARILWVYMFGAADAHLDSPGMEKQSKAVSPLRGLSLGVQTGPSSRCRTTPMTTPRGDYTPRMDMDHSDFVGAGFTVQQDIVDDITVGNTAQVQINPIQIDEGDDDDTAKEAVVEGAI